MPSPSIARAAEPATHQPFLHLTPPPLPRPNRAQVPRQLRPRNPLRELHDFDDVAPPAPSSRSSNRAWLAFWRNFQLPEPYQFRLTPFNSAKLSYLDPIPPGFRPVVLGEYLPHGRALRASASTAGGWRPSVVTRFTPERLANLTGTAHITDVPIHEARILIPGSSTSEPQASTTTHET